MPRFRSVFPASRPRLSTCLQWLAVAGLSGGAVWLLVVTHFPAALLLGPVIVSTIFGVSGTRLRMPRRLHEAAQGVAGCMIAHYLTPEIFGQIVAIWPTVLLFVTLTLAIASLVGFIVGLLARVDNEEAIWGFLPGMAGAVIAMSHERGLDSRIVAFIQVVRLLSVILVMSIISRLLIEGAPAASASGAVGAFHPGVSVTILVALCGPLAARFIPFLPAAPTLVPLTIAALLQTSGLVTLALPGWLLVVAYFVLGAQVGLRFTPDLMRHAASIFVPVVLAAMGLMALCGLSGIALAWIVGTDMLTGMLATVPGSIETIAIIAINSKADVSFVMTLQVIRLFAVILVGPFVARSLCRFAKVGNARNLPNDRTGVV